jgi:hypothetical protein
MRTRVYITVDVECAEERGTGPGAKPAQGWDVRVWGRFVNQRRELGIRLIMDELEEHGHRGTFFVEALGSRYFGLEGLRATCGALRARGHDVQLHTHPIQRQADWRSRGEEPASDDIGSYAPSAQLEMLRDGIERLVECGVSRDDLVAFRAGNYGASNETWRAMKDAGLCLSSNYNPCYLDKNCRMRVERAAAGLFEAAPGVWELPISNMRERGGAHRHAQITAISSAEMRDYLEQAHAMGLREVTVVTHSFELYHIDSIDRRRGRINRVNHGRLRALARFLAQHRDRFEVDTCGELGRRLRAGKEQAAPAYEMPRGKEALRLRRFVEQAYKRLEARVPFL